MSAASNYTEGNILSAVLRGVSFPIPSGTYIALYTSDPTDANSGTEVSTSNWPAYARQDAAAGAGISTGWAVPGAGAGNSRQTSNAKKLTFSKNLGSTVTVTHWGILDALSGGNLLFHKALTASKQVGYNDDLSFAIGALVVNIVGASTYLNDMILNSALRGQSFTLPSTIYVSLHTGDPGITTGANEVSTGAWPAYARKDAAAGGAISSGWTAPADGSGDPTRKESKNAKQVLWAANNGAASVTVTHYALFDAITSGNMLVPDALDLSKVLEVGDEFAFDISDLVIAAK